MSEKELQKANEQIHQRRASNKVDRLGDLPPDSSAKCEQCGFGPKYTEHGSVCKWCYRCIRVFRAKNIIVPANAEYRIRKEVELLYIDAKVDDLDMSVRNRLLQLGYGKDVFMFGAVGVGKTYAMAALLRHYIYEGFECRRINFDDFCVQVRSTMGAAATETEWDMIEPMKDVDKLFIDDLGLRSKQETDFAYVTLYSILNKRQERRLPTFISSNKNIERLGEQFDMRVASRLSTAEIIELTGKDRRKD